MTIGRTLGYTALVFLVCLAGCGDYAAPELDTITAPSLPSAGHIVVYEGEGIVDDDAGAPAVLLSSSPSAVRMLLGSPLDTTLALPGLQEAYRYDTDLYVLTYATEARQAIAGIELRSDRLRTRAGVVYWHPYGELIRRYGCRPPREQGGVAIYPQWGISFCLENRLGRVISAMVLPRSSPPEHPLPFRISRAELQVLNDHDGDGFASRYRVVCDVDVPGDTGYAIIGVTRQLTGHSEPQTIAVDSLPRMLVDTADSDRWTFDLDGIEHAEAILSVAVRNPAGLPIADTLLRLNQESVQQDTASGPNPPPITEFDPSKDLLAHFPIDSTFGDSVVAGRTLLAYKTVLTPDRIGTAGQACRIHDDAYLGVPEEIFQGLGDFTFVCWLRFEMLNRGTTSGINTVLSLANGTMNELLFYYKANESRFKCYFNNTGFAYGIDSTPGDDAWHHVAVTRFLDQSCVYVDGMPVGDTVFVSPGPFQVDTNGAVIGQDQDIPGGGFDPAQALNGLIDDIRIYDRALSAEEVDALRALP